MWACLFSEKGYIMSKKKGYKFTNRIHSSKAIMSSVFGALSSISLIGLIYLSYQKGGMVPVNYGIAGILVLIFAVIGAVLGVLSMQEKDKYKLFVWIGLILNFMVIASISGVLYAGSYL